LNVFIIFTFLGSTRHGNLSVFMFYDFETTIIRIFEIIYLRYNLGNIQLGNMLGYNVTLGNI
jgi:hypothetical protein